MDLSIKPSMIYFILVFKKINYVITFSLFLDPYLLNQYSPVPRARSSILDCSIVGKDATRQR